MSEAGTCALCGASIIWLRLYVSDILISVNADPDPTGTISIVDGKGHTNVSDLYDKTLDSDLPRYKSHSLTCPKRTKQPVKKKKEW